MAEESDLKQLVMMRIAGHPAQERLPIQKPIIRTSSLPSLK
jgi:hypothetical protein